MTVHQFVKQHQRWERPATIGFLGATKHSAWSEFIAPFEQQSRKQGGSAGTIWRSTIAGRTASRIALKK
jgi:hypothetical protein